MNSNIIKYLQALIAFKSITPLSNGSIEYIGKLLIENGFQIEIKEFGNDGNKVQNLYAVYGNGRPNICFSGHVDVVPAGNLDLWDSDPFIARQCNNKIYGRGAVDMKGAIACMMAATFEFIKKNHSFKGQISFLLTSDEEGEAQYGSKVMLEYLKNQNIAIDLVILGEPTCENKVGDLIKIGRRGSINFILNIFGKQGHVAYPHEAINPLHYLVNIMHELINLPIEKENEYFSKSNLEIVSVDTGNITFNVIPAMTSVKFNIRFNNIYSDKDLMILIKQRIEKYTREYELIPQVSAQPFLQVPNGIINDFLSIVQKVSNENTKFSTSGGTSDARFIKNYYNVVECGLLSKMAHKINEYAEISDLQKLYSVYYTSLSKFLK